MKQREWGPGQERRFRIITFVILIALFVGIYFINPDFYSTVYHLSSEGNLKGTIAYLKSFGIYAALISFVIDVLINLVGFLPSIFLSTANGLVFGVFWGTIISWLGETTGVAISFWVMRVLFRGAAIKLIEKHKTLQTIDQYDTWKAVAIARAIPYMPNGLVTAIASISSMRFRDHLIGSLIGKLPSVAIEVMLGHDVVLMKQHAMRLTILVIAITVIYFIIWRVQKKHNKKNEAASTGGEKK